MKYEGHCHCRALGFTFDTDRPLAPRACRCGFCRKHAARTVADPRGSALLDLGADVVRYRFGTRTTDFLICGRCGVYVGAAAELGGQL